MAKIPASKGLFKRYLVFASGIGLLLVIGATLYFALNDSTIQIGALTVCLVFARLIQISKFSLLERLSRATDVSDAAKAGAKKLSLKVWAIGALLLFVWIASYAYLSWDADHGHQRVSAVYLFFVASVLNSLYWPFIFAFLR